MTLVIDDILNELIEEHKHGRKVLKELEDAKNNYKKGKKDSLSVIRESLKNLTDFYPGHIQKEDKHFFMPVMNYFDDTEKNKMLEKMNEFDRNMIHEKYADVIENIQ